jgi:hypothetical protein
LTSGIFQRKTEAHFVPVCSVRYDISIKALSEAFRPTDSSSSSLGGCMTSDYFSHRRLAEVAGVFVQGILLDKTGTKCDFRQQPVVFWTINISENLCDDLLTVPIGVSKLVDSIWRKCVLSREKRIRIDI